jgi:4-amino-4-deoxychorismate lyase
MILVNGVAADALAATDRGLAYGDGVFRTLRMRRGQPIAWPDHYRKLQHDCAALGIPCPERETLLPEVLQASGPFTDAAAKIIITRGSGERGYAPSERPDPTRIVMAAPLSDNREIATSGIKARVCTLRLGAQPALAGVKHLNRLENVLARREWSDPDIREGLLLDEAGDVVGGTMSNLFIVESAILITPVLERTGVAGVTRQRILERAVRSDVACRVERMPLERVRCAAEMFFVNSVIGVWPVRELEGRTWDVGPVAARVRQWLDEGGD